MSAGFYVKYTGKGNVSNLQLRGLEKGSEWALTFLTLVIDPKNAFQNNPKSDQI